MSGGKSLIIFSIGRNASCLVEQSVTMAPGLRWPWAQLCRWPGIGWTVVRPIASGPVSLVCRVGLRRGWLLAPDAAEALRAPEARWSAGHGPGGGVASRPQMAVSQVWHWRCWMLADGSCKTQGHRQLCVRALEDGDSGSSRCGQERPCQTCGPCCFCCCFCCCFQHVGPCCLTETDSLSLCARRPSTHLQR
jgi:hypothetical protein